MKTTTKKITKRQIQQRIDRANKLWDKYHELDVMSQYCRAPLHRVEAARRKYIMYVHDAKQWLYEAGLCGEEGITSDEADHDRFWGIEGLAMFGDGSWVY